MPLYRIVFNMPDGSKWVWDRTRPAFVVGDWVVFIKDRDYAVSKIVRIENGFLHCEYTDENGTIEDRVEMAERLRPHSGISIGF